MSSEMTEKYTQFKSEKLTADFDELQQWMEDKMELLFCALEQQHVVSVGVTMRPAEGYPERTYIAIVEWSFVEEFSL